MCGIIINKSIKILSLQNNPSHLLVILDNTKGVADIFYE